MGRSNQGLPEYVLPTKKNWRGWWQNRVVERLAVPVEEATVLYLCGPEDRDRAKLLAKGFRNENVIAVDLDEQNIARVRRAGGFGAAHDLIDLLFVWPDDWRVDAVFADFCGGLNKTADRFFGVIVLHLGLRNPDLVFGANFLRGRDSWTTPARAEFRAETAECLVSPAERQQLTSLEKHRGYMFACSALWVFAQEDGEPPVPHKGVALRDYRSGPQYFDSAVLRLTGPLTLTEELFTTAVGASLLGKNLNNARDLARMRAAKRKIAALRAVRTKRLQSGRN